MKKALPSLFALHDVDYCIANVENAAGGFGVTREICDEFLAMGVDCMTSGNHIWDKREIIPVIDGIPQLLRPANYPEGQPGKGTYVGRGKDSRVAVALEAVDFAAGIVGRSEGGREFGGLHTRTGVLN